MLVGKIAAIGAIAYAYGLTYELIESLATGKPPPTPLHLSIATVCSITTAVLMARFGWGFGIELHSMFETFSRSWISCAIALFGSNCASIDWRTPDWVNFSLDAVFICLTAMIAAATLRYVIRYQVARSTQEQSPRKG